MAKRSRSKAEGPGNPDESGEEGDISPGIIPVDPTVWRVRHAQKELNKACKRSFYGHHEEQLNQTIELAVFDGDISAIAHLQTQVPEFRVLQNAMRGDQQALATVADAFADLGYYDHASAFSILAGDGPWHWGNVFWKKLDTGHCDQLLRRLRGIIPQSDKGTRKKND